MWVDRDLWRNVFQATQKVLAAGLLALLHHGLDIAFEHTLAGWPQILRASSVLAAVAFLVIYAVLLLEAAAMFLPSVPTVLNWAGIRRGILKPRNPDGGNAANDVG